MKDYVVLKCAFTSSNQAWALKITFYDEIFTYSNSTKAEQKVMELTAAETGSNRTRIYKWEHWPGYEKKKEKEKQDEQDENN